MTYPASNIIDIVARISPAGLGAANFGTALLLARSDQLKVGADPFPTDSFKVFSNPSELLDFFEESSEPYKAVNQYFQPTPKPREVKVWLRDEAGDTAVESLAKAMDATWFYWFTPTVADLPDSAAYLAIQSWAGANSKFFAATTTSADVLNAGLTTDPVSVMTAAGVRHSFIEYHDTNDYAGFQTAALFARVNYSAANSTITAFGKKKPGLTALDLSTTNYNTLETKKAVFYTKVEAGGQVDDGRVLKPFSTSSFGETIADIVDTDAAINSMLVANFNYLTNTTTKVPQTPPGQQGAIDAVGGVCEQYYTNGFLGAREYEDGETGETKIAEHGYVILTKPEDIFTISEADRAAKKLAPVRARIFRAGAAFEISVLLDVE